MARAPRQITLEEASAKVALSPDVARHLVSPALSRNLMYGLIARGEIPSIRVGGNEDGQHGRILVLTAPFFALFGLRTVESAGMGAENEAAGSPPITHSDASHRSPAHRGQTAGPHE